MAAPCRLTFCSQRVEAARHHPLIQPHPGGAALGRATGLAGTPLCRPDKAKPLPASCYPAALRLAGLPVWPERHSVGRVRRSRYPHPVTRRRCAWSGYRSCPERHSVGRVRRSRFPTQSGSFCDRVKVNHPAILFSKRFTKMSFILLSRSGRRYESLGKPSTHS